MTEHHVPRRIYVAPHCDHCRDELGDVTWCEDDIHEPCEKCGMIGIAYGLEPGQPAFQTATDDEED